MITGYYIVNTHYDKWHDGDFVTPLLGPFPDEASMQAAAVAFVPWYQKRYPGTVEKMIEPCAYSAFRLPLGRCNVEYGFYPFENTSIPPGFRT